MKKYVLWVLALVQFSIYGQGEGGVFTSQRLASIKTGEGSLGNNPAALNWFQDLRNKTAKLGSEQKLGLDDIEGTVYDDESFKKGYIYYRYALYGEYELRYDAFNDEIELKRTAGGPIEALHKSEAISCTLEGREFYYTPFLKRSGELVKGYLIKIYEGKAYTLYVRKSKNFKEGKPAKTSLQNSFPPRFVDEQRHYLAIAEGRPFELKSTKKEFLQLVGKENQGALKKFFKEHGIRLNDEEDVVRTVKFMDAL